MLGVPLLREGRMPRHDHRRLEARPGAIEPGDELLLTTFAEQAVIAIENVRLFNETKEALEQRTASAEILRVISSSMTDTQPVFDAIVQSCQRLFGGRAVNLLLRSGDALQRIAIAGDGAVHSEAGIDEWPLGPRQRRPATACSAPRSWWCPTAKRSMRSTRARASWPLRSAGVSGLFVPLLKDGQAIGCIGVLRATTGSFEPKDVELAQTFADQAVIAIENVRLFNETKEALEQQKAAAEILQRHQRLGGRRAAGVRQDRSTAASTCSMAMRWRCSSSTTTPRCICARCAAAGPRRW